MREERKTLFQVEECNKILIKNLIEREDEKLTIFYATCNTSRDVDQILPKSFSYLYGTILV